MQALSQSQEASQVKPVIKLVSCYAPKTKRIKRSNRQLWARAIQAQGEFTPDTEF